MPNAFAEIVHSTIINEVKESEVFALLADEAKDAGKTEQLSLVLGYYCHGEVKESFLHFEALELEGLYVWIFVLQNRATVIQSQEHVNGKMLCCF